MFISPSFLNRWKTASGIALFVIGSLGILMLLILTSIGPRLPDPASPQFAIDFRDYWIAAGRMASGGSPYNPDMLAGPLGSSGLDMYRYPPVLAFLLIPLSVFDYVTAGWIWVGLSVAALTSGLTIALRAGGTKITFSVAIWTAAATVWFFPTPDSLFKGNVEGLQVLLIALALSGGSGLRGSSVVSHAWLKVAPVLLVPALIVRDGRRGLAWLFVWSAALVVPALLWAPAAFWQLPVILLNISGAGTPSATNLAPNSWATMLSGSSEIGAVARMITLVGAAALVRLSVHLARRPPRWPAAVLAGVCASLLLPGTTWEHYLLVLLPFGVYVWPRLTQRQRVALLIGGATISAGGTVAVLAFSGAVIFSATAMIGLLGPRVEAQASRSSDSELEPLTPIPPRLNLTQVSS